MRLGRVLLAGLAVLGVGLLGFYTVSAGFTGEEGGAVDSWPGVAGLEDDVEGLEEAWPPEAWASGDIEALSLSELAYVVGGVVPGSEGAASVDEELARLEQLPPRYTEVAHRTLGGLALAAWHQEQARGPLSAEEQAALAGVGPDEPLTREAQDALAKLDQRHVALAAGVLTATARDIESMVDRDPAPASVGDALREGFGHTEQRGAVPRVLEGSSDPAVLAELIVELSGDPLTPEEQDVLAGDLAGAPRDGRQAVGHVLKALVPFAGGPPEGAEEALVHLGDAIDASRGTLEVWGAQASAARFVDVHRVSAEDVEVPDANADVPPLRVAHGAGSVMPEAPEDLTGALERLALAFNDTVTAESAAEHMEPLEGALTMEQQAALGRVLAAMAAYLEALEEVPVEDVPSEVSKDPGVVEGWASMLEEGRLVVPGSDEAMLLLEARPYLDAVVDVHQAREGLLEAAEDLVPSFTQPASSSSATDPRDPCQVDPDLDHVVVSFYLQADFCGVDKVWEEGAMLTLDVGGENVHTHRAAAPFNATERVNEGTGSLIGIQGQEVWVPVSLTFDLGDSTEYRPSDTDLCTLGATCSLPPPVQPCLILPSGFLANSCGTARDSLSLVRDSLLANSPVAVLVDWSGDGVEVENLFVGGDRSQGSGSNAVLIERVGRGSTLSSSYKAGEVSQAAREGLTLGGNTVLPFGTGPSSLVRLVGDGSVSESRFQAGNKSQGSDGVFLNIGGDEVVHDDGYRAGATSQGAVVGGVFVDFAGEATQSNDVHVAGDRSQGWFGGVFISGTGQGSVSNDRFEMPNETEGRGFDGYFVSIVEPTPQDSGEALEAEDEVVVVSPSGGVGVSSNDDVYVGAQRGYGHSTPSGADLVGILPPKGSSFFLDLGGDNEYPEDANAKASEFPWTEAIGETAELDDGPCNNCAWYWGFDGEFGDADRDAFPDVVNALWPGALWESDPDDEDASPSPAPARALIDLQATDLHVNRSYAFILSVGGDDTYTENASAGVLLDLAGEDRYEGHVGAASFDLPQRVLAFALDLGGPDKYIAPTVNKTQGYGSGGGSGLLFNLAGNNVYWANSHAQGAANGTLVAEAIPETEDLPGPANPNGMSLPGLGVLFDGTDPQQDELNLFRVHGPPSQGEGENAGTGILIAAGEDNRFASGGHTTQDALSDQDIPNGAHELFEELDQECETDDEWPSPGARCSERAGERVEDDNGGYGLRVNLGEPASPGALHGLTLGLSEKGSDEDQNDDAPPVVRVGESIQFLAEVTHKDGDDVTFTWTFDQGEQGSHSETETVLGSHDGEETFQSLSQHAWERADGIQVTTQPNGDTSGEAAQEFMVQVAAMDPRGAKESTATTVKLEHEPIQLLHLDDVLGPGQGSEPILLLGPKDVTLSGSDQARLAYQLPVNETRGHDRILTEARWPGGGYNASHQVDWARPSNWQGPTPSVSLPEGATSILPPEGSEQIPSHVTPREIWLKPPADCLVGSTNGAQEILDGSPSTGLEFQLAGPFNNLGSPGFCPAVHFDVHLPQPRQIHGVNMTVRVDGLLDGATFTVHGVAPNGSVERIGTFDFENDQLQERSASAPFGVYESFLVRQQITPRLKTVDASINVTSFEAQGPGVIATPPAGDGIPLEVGVVDEAGAVNKTVEDITVDPGIEAGGIVEDGNHPIVRVDGFGARGAPHHTTLVTNRTYTLTLAPTATAHLIGEELCVQWEADGAESQQVGCVDLEDARDSDGALLPVSFSLEWDTPGVRAVYWNLTGGELEEADMSLMGHITTVHGEPGFDLIPSGVGPLLFLVLGDEDQGQAPLDTWHYADRRRGVPNYLGIVDGGGNDRYVGDHAVPRPLVISNANSALPPTNVGAFPSLVVDRRGDDDFLSTGSFTQGYGYFGSVGVLWSADGDDRYVAASHAQGAAYKQGIGVLLDGGGDDAYNPISASHPGLLGYLPTVRDPGNGLGQRGALLENVTRAWGPMPDAELVQGAGDEGIGLLISTGGDDMFAAGHRAQGFGQHGARNAEEYVLPGSIQNCGLPVGGNPPVPQPNPVAIFCWLGVGTTLNPNNWPTNPALPVPVPPINLAVLNSFVAQGPRYGPGAGILVNANGTGTYHALGQAQGASGPDGRGVLIDADGGFVGSSLREGQGFSDGGHAGLFAGGEHRLWIDGDGQGVSRSSANNPEYPSQAPANRPQYHNATYVRVGGDHACVDGEPSCGTPLEAEAGESPVRVNPSWNQNQEETDVDLQGDVEEWEGSQLNLSITFEVTPQAAEVDVETVVMTQPWNDWSDSCDRKTTGARPLTAPIHAAGTTSEPTQASVTLDVDEEVGGQAVYPAGCHAITVFARAVDTTGVPVGVWERLDGEVVLLSPPRVGLHAQEDVEIVTNLADQDLVLDLASGELLPVVGDDEVEVAFELVPEELSVNTVDLGKRSLSAPGGPEAFHVVSDQVEHGFVQTSCGSPMGLTFHNVPQDAGDLAFFLLRNSPDAPAPTVIQSSWSISIPAGKDTAQSSVPAPCPATRPARVDQSFVLHAYALKTPVKPGQISQLTNPAVQQSLLHGNVLAHDSMRMKATPNPLPFDWGNASHAFGVQETLVWDDVEGAFEASGVDPADLDGAPFTLMAQARWAGQDSKAPAVELGKIIVDTSNKETPIAVTPDPLEVEGLDHWKRTDPLTIHETIQIGEAGVDARPEGFQIRAVFVDEHQGHHSIDPGLELNREEVFWAFRNGSEEDLELQVLDEHEGSPIHVRLTEGEDSNGALTPVIEWEISSLDLLPSTNVFRGGLVKVQARVIDEAGNVPGWGEDAVASHSIFFDGMAPDLSAFQTPDGTTATSDTFPILLSPTLEDGASGVNATRVSAFMMDDAFQLHPLELPQVPTDGESATFDFLWDGDEGPEEGAYEVVVEAEDRVGNRLLMLPGVQIMVDRATPVLEGLDVLIDEDQAWVGNGTKLDISVDAEDVMHHNVSAGLDQVTATFEGDQGEVTLDLARVNEDSPEHEGVLTVPGELTAQPAEVPVNVTACDLAGNCAHLTSKNLTYYPLPPWVVDEEVRERSESIAYDVRTDRPTTVDENTTFLKDSSTDITVGARIDEEGDRHTLVFDGLRPDTLYAGEVVFRDEAGYVTRHSVSFSTAEEVQGTSVTLDPVQGSLSGTIEVSGTVVQSTGGTVSLHAVDAQGVEDIDQMVGMGVLGSEIDIVSIPMGVTRTFSVEVDTLAPPFEPGIEKGVSFVAVFSDESSLWWASTPVHIDNAPPRFNPRVQGPAPTNGWFNGPVIVEANAQDATTPITYRASLEDGDFEDRRSVTVREDGVHTIRFLATDGASPANEGNHTMTVRIDRTTPALNASINLTTSASSSPVVPLSIKANESLSGPSGLDGFRVTTGTNWTPWNASAPDRVVLENVDEGERWIGVQLRDRAGNVAQASLPMVLDRTPPEVLEAWWTEGNQSHRVLKVIAVDRMEGPGLPADVEGVRWAPGLDGAWNPWEEATGQDTLTIPEEAIHDEGVVRVQVRDAAGNMGSVHTLRAGEVVDRTDVFDDRDEDQPVRIPDSDVFSFVGPLVSPASGTEETRFDFSVGVHPWDGEPPKRVWVTVGEHVIELEPRGLIEGGARLYSGSSVLEAGNLGETPVYRFHAAFDEGTVSTDWEAGPLVSKAPSEEVGASILQRVPMVPVGAALLVVLAVALAVWRFRGGGHE